MGTISLTFIYMTISIVVIAMDIIIACHAFVEHKNYSFILATACLGAGLVQGVYLISVFAQNYFWVSFFSSLYFLSVAFDILVLVTFIRVYSIKKFSKANYFIKNSLSVAFLIDAILLMINPFKEIMVHYAYVGGVVAKYAYIKKPLYMYHLALSYIMVAIIIYHLVRRARAVPGEYRRPYIVSILSMLLVIFVNVLFVFFPNVFGKDVLDYSLWGYTLAVFSLYYNFFRYPIRGMRSYYNEWIVENVNQGVVLFNNENTLIIHNDKVHSIFSDFKIEQGMSIEEFTSQLDINNSDDKSRDNYSFQLYVTRDNKAYPIRFDHRCLINKHGDLFGQLFVFTDEAGDVDLLTSFYSWEKFKQIVTEDPVTLVPPITIAICDINGLGDINTRYGKNVGDQAIELLANTIRKHFAGESYYVRGQEASLMVLSFDLNEEQVKEKLQLVRDEMLNSNELECIINIQSATAVVTKDDNDILEIVKQAFRSMKNRKLLDVKSRKSVLVTSLVKTLAECDTDTEEHVKRTQIMGAELGRRLGLSDMQQSDLALLCLLHDIGKIGIPLEILNKPGRLNDSEWRMMKTHTDKGYQIATSSQELSHIADMIRHHHECWDGHGYPDGLTKESIPLLSRIISVVDAYDAMVNDRVYRPALSVENAIKELKRCAGSQFDPSIVNEFVRMLPEIGEVKENYNIDVISAASKISSQPSVALDQKEIKLGASNVHNVTYSRYVLNSDMVIVNYDNQFEKLTGYTKEDVEKGDLTQIALIPEEDRTEYLRLVNEQLSQNNLAYFEHRLKKKDGSIIYVFCFGKAYYDSAEKEERSEVIVCDSANTYSMKLMISEEKNKAEVRLAKWEDKYRCDSLTGLLNHEAFKNDIEQKLINDESKIMLLMMDVDKFKQYNDTYGHRAGDEFLIMLSHALTETLRKNDLACRMGGDEFAAALFYDDSITDSVMYDRAQQICDKLNMILSNQKGGTSLSMGIVTTKENKTTFNKLYEQADSALYQAKESGRARMVVYNEVAQ